MPPINAKVEAQRLQQAKSVIKKMKQKRTEGNRVKIHKAKPTVKDPVLFFNVKKETMDNIGSQSVLHDLNDRVTKKKSTAAGRIKKVATTSCKTNGVSDQVSREDVSRKQRNSDFVSKKISMEEPIANFQKVNGHSDRIYTSPQCSKVDSASCSKTKSPELDNLSDFDSPFIAASRIGKVYTSKKKDSDNPIIRASRVGKTNRAKKDGDEEPMDVLNVSNRDSTRPLKLKGKKIKRLHKNKNICSVKKRFAPMSVTMKPGSIQGPIFTVTQDDSGNSDESRGKEILSAQVAKKKDSCLSAFSVTTVCEKTLPSKELTDDEVMHSCSESEVQSDDSQPEVDDRLSNAGSECEFEDVVETSEKVLQLTNDWSRAEFHFIDGHVVLNLKHPSTFIFCGQVQLEVLKGTVEILGYRLTPESGCHTVFSARGSSLLSVQTVLTDDECHKSHILEESNSLASLAAEGNDGDAMLLMKKSENTLPQFLEQYVNIKLFPAPPEKVNQHSYWKASKRLQCLCYPPSASHKYQKGEDWDDVCENIGLQSGCTVICGGKGVGKSTMLRFMVNRLLSCGKKSVLLIDFDPGQTELTVPGCVSISLVAKPLLGPNFTHLQDPLKCIYVGDINVSNCVSRYMDACLAIINYWRSDENLRDIPCVVNTMGFNKGLGVSIIVETLSLLQPTGVIQVQSKISSRNYPEQLSVEYVKRMCSSSPFRLQLMAQGHQVSCPSSLDYKLHIVKSVTDTLSEHHDSLGISARPAREIVLLSYLSLIASTQNLSLLEAVPYCCPLDSLYLNICHENVPPSAALSAFNASLVALCSVSPEEVNVIRAGEPGLPSILTGRNVANCLGFGIVRGIDMESQNLYLLTPVPPNILDNVNCLVLGAVCLPQCVYLTPPKEPGPVPFVVVTESQHAALPSKRSFRFNRL
ncbi:hypothetical protein FOCC_FOCC006640 [Frankliniella occidentalis]|uniref:Polynucleotide 5'-hydroxyl-kinase NOL9 n=1 Tax=Frankliniella occidentalis TaxID=133901 RepID=A0A6J1T6K0_FRAOC|nr:polynucleotide 5'-hydroxyl-kinase NOL9 [Frankliniella occidentalis]KAE8746657.1 hypothetical protein FOCC_FOCC006640 [Frankliniella occidentalis]